MATESTQLKRLRAERTHLRRNFTVAANALEADIAGNAGPGKVKEAFSKLEDKANRLFKVDSSIFDIVLSSTTHCDGEQDELAKEYDTSENYRDNFNANVSKMNDYLQSIADNVSVQSGVFSAKCKPTHLKLPKLLPKKFDGNLRNWISFWAMFHRIHDSEEYDPEEKFQYLLMYLVEDSEPWKMVNSFPPSAGNYTKAIEQLKSRFGRDDILIELYIRDLLKLVLTRSKGESTSLRSLYDQLETQLRALETLGVARDKYTFLLTPLIESALPDTVLKEWGKEIISSNDQNHEILFTADNNKMNKLMNFLRREVESEERMFLARDNFNEERKLVQSHIQTQPSTSTSQKAGKLNFMAATDLVNLKTPFTPSCIFCDSSTHVSENCFSARTRTIDENQLILNEKRSCLVCLKPNHQKHNCRAKLRCIICEGGHFPLMCPQRKVTRQSMTDSQRLAEVDHNLSNFCQNSVVMQTLSVHVKGSPGVTIRALFDSGSQRSYITKALASRLNITAVGGLRMEHALFGGTRSKPQNHKCYKIHLVSVDREYACNFDVLDSEVICEAVPSVPISSLLPELELKGIILTDQKNGPIDLLIGADVGGKLMSGRKVELSGGVVALHTFLGWTLMGKIPHLDQGLSTSNVSLATISYSEEDLGRLDTIGIDDSTQIKTEELLAEEARRHFEESVRILPDGRYEVSLPWLGHPPKSNNFILASKRLQLTLKKLRSSNNEQDYADIFEYWLNDGIIEIVPPDNWDEGHYLPHRPVIKSSSNTPVRPVFDVPAREKGVFSLNQRPIQRIYQLDFSIDCASESTVDAVAADSTYKSDNEDDDFVARHDVNTDLNKQKKPRKLVFTGVTRCGRRVKNSHKIRLKRLCLKFSFPKI